MQAAAPGGAGEWQAAGAPPRFLPVPPPRPHPAATPGRASGWLRRQRWVALLVLGLLVAGAADGCELVPRHLRVRRASSSAAAAASSAAAAGDSPALMTGEGPGAAGGARLALTRPPSPGGAGASAGRPLFNGLEHCAMPSRAPRLQRPGCCFVAVPYTPHAFPLIPTSTPLSTEPLDGPPFNGAPRRSTLSNAEVLFCAAEWPAGSAGDWADFFFFKLLGKVSNSNAVLSLSLALLLQRQLEASFQVQSPAEHSIPGEAAEEDSLRALIPSGTSGSVLVCGNL